MNFLVVLKPMELDQFTPPRVCYLFKKKYYSECVVEKWFCRHFATLGTSW